MHKTIDLEKTTHHFEKHLPPFCIHNTSSIIGVCTCSINTFCSGIKKRWFFIFFLLYEFIIDIAHSWLLCQSPISLLCLYCRRPRPGSNANQTMPHYCTHLCQLNAHCMIMAIDACGMGGFINCFNPLQIYQPRASRPAVPWRPSA